jgi:hypothetical protein
MMMKQFVLVALLVTSSLLAFSQRDFKGGILAGPVASQMSGDGLGGWDKVGFSAGAWVSMPLSDKMALNIAMKYITKGSRTKRDTLNFNTFAYHLNYIDVPVLLSYRVLGRKTSLDINVGPYVGILMKQKIVSNGYDYEINPAFKGVDVGASGGITWWLGERFFFDASLATSIIPVRPAPVVVNKANYYEYGNYNQSMHFTLGWSIGSKNAD